MVHYQVFCVDYIIDKILVLISHNLYKNIEYVLYYGMIIIKNM